MESRIKIRNLLAGTVLTVLAVPSAMAASMGFVATLTGNQEVPPVQTAAFGSGILRLNDSMDQLEIIVSAFGVDFFGATDDLNDDVTVMHIHAAPAGENGPVVFGFIGPNSDLNGDLTLHANASGGTISSIWDANEGNNTTLMDQLDNLFSGGLYFNIHTVANPGGEIRGQIQFIPIPATAWLLISGGAFGLAAMRRLGRRRV